MSYKLIVTLSITGIFEKSSTTETFDSNKCQEELREHYLEEMGKVNLLPWIPGERKEMERIFVDLELVRKEDPKSSKVLKKKCGFSDS